jgi:hypothetical protein
MKEHELFENPFRCPGNWYRANLHAHTTSSDGDLSPADCAEFYHNAGYQILAITDHWHVTDLVSDRSDFLIIPGAELDGGRTAQRTSFHIVGLNMRSRGRIEHPGGTAQEIVDFIRNDGGEVVIAHPYWSGLMATEIAPVAGAFAIEVYNTGCDLEILRGFSTVQWDDLLSLGRDFGAVAVDDGHHHKVDHGLGWTMIRAAELSVEAVMEALLRGRYYSSIGPQIKDLRIADGRIRVKTSPVRSIALVSTPGRGGRAFGREGRNITQAEFALPASRYCRIEAIDREGKVAWSNPMLLPSAA